MSEAVVIAFFFYKDIMIALIQEKVKGIFMAPGEVGEQAAKGIIGLLGK